MHLSPAETLIMILAVMLGAMFTRFTPFILFPDNKKHPPVIDYLSRMLPPAMMGLLIIYCQRNLSVLSAPHGLPEILSIAAISLIHLWRRNVLLSIAGGTVFYMILVQRVFV